MNAVVLKLQRDLESPGELAKTHIVGPIPGVSDSVALGWGLGIYAGASFQVMPMDWKRPYLENPSVNIEHTQLKKYFYRFA